MRTRLGRGAAIQMAGLATVLAISVSGCVSLQTNGSISPVTGGGQQNAPVQVWPSPPSLGALPASIVSGFLEAAGSGPANLAIADDYLTGDALTSWNGGEKNAVLVLADGSESYPQQQGGDPQEGPQYPGGAVAGQSDTAGGEVTERVTGQQVGALSASGQYTATLQSLDTLDTFDFVVKETKPGTYRIADLPAGFGALIARSTFATDYTKHDVYYPNASTSLAGDLIPNQIYLPTIDTDQDLAGALARDVVDGPPPRLGDAVVDEVAHATFEQVQLNSDGSATVTIDGHGYCKKNMQDGNEDPCNELASQLATSLDSLSSKVSSVKVVDQADGTAYTGGPVSNLSLSYGISLGLRGSQGFGFDAISASGTVELVSFGGDSNSVEAPNFGADKSHYSAVAVGPPNSGGPNRQAFALTSQDRTKVFVATRERDQYQLTPIFPNPGSAPAGGAPVQVGPLSWDASGDLWFTVRTGGSTAVYRYTDAGLSQVALTGLPGQLEQVAVAPDGQRVAVSYQNGSGYGIDVAPVQQTDGGLVLNLSTGESAANAWTLVTGFDWYSEDSLAVLGTQGNAQTQELYQIYTDGSSEYDALTQQPVAASVPNQAAGFVWVAGGQPIAYVNPNASNQNRGELYLLSAQGQNAQLISGVFGTSPSY